jgi:hypothetical protein
MQIIKKSYTDATPEIDTNRYGMPEIDIEPLSKGLSTATLCMKGTGARTFQYFVFLFFLSATLLNSAPSSYLVIASSSFASSSVASSSVASSSFASSSSSTGRRFFLLQWREHSAKSQQ